MVCEHLRVVFALFLDVNYKNLLDPETPLDEIVPFEQALNLAEGPAFPDGVQVQPEVGVIDDVLSTR